MSRSVVSQIGTFSEIAKTFHRHFSGKSYDFVKNELVINETSRKPCVYIGTFSEIVGRFHRHFFDFIKHELAINETSWKLAYI